MRKLFLVLGLIAAPVLAHAFDESAPLETTPAGTKLTLEKDFLFSNGKISVEIFFYPSATPHLPGITNCYFLTPNRESTNYDRIIRAGRQLSISQVSTERSNIDSLYYRFTFSDAPITMTCTNMNSPGSKPTIAELRAGLRLGGIQLSIPGPTDF